VPKSFFDIVCLGTELPGLIASALLAKQGYRVLLAGAVEKPEKPGPGTLQRGRAPLLFVGDHSSPIIRWAVSHLSLTQEMRNRLRPLVPSYQVVLPGHRLEMGGRSPDTDAEVKRELPELYDQLDPLCSKAETGHEALQGLFDPPLVIPPTRWTERRALRLRLRSLGLDERLQTVDPFTKLEPANPLRLLFDAPLRFLTGGDPNELCPFCRTRLLGHLGRGISLVAGDRPGLAELVLERFTTYGGVVRKGAGALESIQLGWSGSALLNFDHGREEFGCRLILCNQPPQQLTELLPESRKKRQLAALADKAEVVGYRVAFRLLVRAELLPEAMSPVLFLVTDPAAPLHDDNLLLLTVAGEGESRILSVAAQVDAARLQQGGSTTLAELQVRMEERVRRLLPFLDLHLLERGTLQAESFQPLYALDRQAPGCLGRLTYCTPYRQVLLGGMQMLPALGLEGEFLTGVSLSQVVNSLVKRHDLLPR